MECIAKLVIEIDGLFTEGWEPGSNPSRRKPEHGADSSSLKAGGPAWPSK